MSYQGHENHATWSVSLWLNNDEGLYLGAKELLANAGNQADALREFVQDAIAFDTERVGIGSDVKPHHLFSVDWNTIIEDFLNE